MAKVVLEFEKPILELEEKIEELRRYGANPDIAAEIARIEKKVHQLQQSVFAGLTRWQRVQLARHPERPYTLDYIAMMTTDFVELHGDRAFRDDKANCRVRFLELGIGGTTSNGCRWFRLQFFVWIGHRCYGCLHL